MRKMDTTKTIALGFMLLILTGAVLLSLPFASADGTAKPFIDALFTSTTSVCVTGLTTVAPASFSLFGQIVILLLIQFGGLGVVTVSMILIMMISRRISIQDTKLIFESYGLNNMNDMAGFVLKVVKCALGAEAVGAVLFAFQFIPEFGLIRGLWYAVFHSISAFCNAGLDLFGSTSFHRFLTAPIVNFTTIGLIFMGNIGFVVWWDVADLWNKRKKIGGLHFRRLTVHTRLVLITSIIIYVIPVLMILGLEFNNPDTIGGLNFGQKVMASMFEGATFRTAGFETFAQSAMKDASALIGVILMFIGGSPTGTAGGAKTAAVAILLVFIASVIKGKSDPEIFKRRISMNAVRSALMVVGLNMICIFIGSILIMIVEGAGFRDTIFEVTSAITTTGLSSGVCADLTLIGKIIFIVCMFIGRIGALTFITAMKRGRNNKVDFAYAEEKILIG